MSNRLEARNYGTGMGEGILFKYPMVKSQGVCLKEGQIQMPALWKTGDNGTP